jgi:small subunit ribosomal protein S19
MKKPDFQSSIFLDKLIKYKPKQKVFNRNSFLLPYALNKIFYVHNGITFLSVMVNEEIIGHKLGEFSQTRRRYFFKKKTNTKKKK